MTLNTSPWRQNFFSFLQSIVPFGKTKTHDFRKYQKGIEYSVDFANSYNTAQMVTGINVRKGEHIILSDREQTLKYYAETVDYYWNSDSLREIALKRILQQS